MTDFIDELDKSLKETKSTIEKNREIWSKIVGEQRKIEDNFFNENLLKDFEKLEKVYKNHISEYELPSENSIEFFKDSKIVKIFSQLISLGKTTELIIKVDSKTPSYPSRPESIKDLEKYKPSVENIYFEVSRLDENEYGDKEEFKHSLKENAYKYFDKNFKIYILNILSEDYD
jgi:predicted nuclease with TOPRIM domain